MPSGSGGDGVCFDREYVDCDSFISRMLPSVTSSRPLGQPISMQAGGHGMGRGVSPGRPGPQLKLCQGQVSGAPGDVHSRADSVRSPPLPCTALHPGRDTEPSSSLGDQIWLQNGSDRPQVGQIRDFSRSDLRTFWLIKPKCTEI